MLFIKYTLIQNLIVYCANETFIWSRKSWAFEKKDSSKSFFMNLCDFDPEILDYNLTNYE